MSNDKTMIAWTPEMLARFKRAYDGAEGLSGFRFDGNYFVRLYAKYLIEYLDMKFKGK